MGWKRPSNQSPQLQYIAQRKTPCRLTNQRKAFRLRSQRCSTRHTSESAAHPQYLFAEILFLDRQVSRNKLLALRGLAYTFDILAIAGGMACIDILKRPFTLSVAWMLLYFPLTEWLLKGRTPGKWLFRLVVIGPNGEPPTLIQSLVRNFCRLLETNPFLLGPLVATVIFVYSARCQRLGDMLARTYVIPRRDLLAISAEIRAQPGQ